MPLTKKQLELLVSLVLIAIGAAAMCTVGLAEDSASPFLLSQERALGGGLDYGTFPRIYAGALIILGVLNILLISKSGLREGTHAGQPEKRRQIALLTVLTGIFTLVYTLSLPYVPFVPATTVFLFAMFRLYGQKSLLRNAVIAAAGAGLLWFVFIRLSHLAI